MSLMARRVHRLVQVENAVEQVSLRRAAARRGRELRARATKSKVGTSSGRVIGEHPKGKGV